MPYNTATGVYSATSGAETAQAGQVIASATWNQINVDYRTALNQLGPQNVPYFRGGQPSNYLATAIGVNFAASASDIASFTIPLPVSVSNYTISSVRFSNAGGNLNGVSVSLFTGANVTGVAVLSSTAMTITSSAPGSSNSYQLASPASVNTVSYNAPILFLHVTTSVATSNTADVMLTVQPIY